MATNQKPTPYNDFMNKQKLFRLNRLLSSKKVIIIIMIAIPFILLFAGNICYTLLSDALYSMKGIFAADMAANDHLPAIINFPKSSNYYLILFGLTVFLEIALPYKIRTAYNDFNVNQKGGARFAYLEELYEQYPAVPEKDEFYQGKGGVPIAWDRKHHKVFIDRSAVNNYIIGTTRSGKGESFMFPTIDLYSRAEKKSSLIITDPKLELYKASYKTLKKRGYIPLVLNLADPGKSMKFNPLQTIIDAWKRKDYPTAEQICASFCFSMFADDKQPDPFWPQTATNLLSAMIIAHVSDCIALDEEMNAKNKAYFDKQKAAFMAMDEIEQLQVRNFIENMEYGYEDILHSSMPIPPEYEYIPSTKYEKQITMYSIYNAFTVMATNQMGEDKTALDAYFNARPNRDSAKLKYTAANVAGSKTKGSIYSTMITKLTIFTYENYAKMTAENDIDLLDIGFGEKPYAIFISTPDYDKSSFFIASVFVRQLYYVLAQHCTIHTNDGKCKREVVFLLDEFGSMSPIENFATMLVVCLGRNIRFNLVAQSDAQIEEKYGKEAETIIGNCGNQYFLSSGDLQTVKHFSEQLGNETFKNVSRSGEKMSLNKSFTESYEEKPLLNPNELQGLAPGENVIIRIMTRTDLRGNSIEHTSIYNVGNQRFKYRYKYLTKSFPNLDKIDLDKITWGDTSKVNLDLHVYDIDAHFAKLAAKMEAEKASKGKASGRTPGAGERNKAKMDEAV